MLTLISSGAAKRLILSATFVLTAIVSQSRLAEARIFLPREIQEEQLNSGLLQLAAQEANANSVGQQVEEDLEYRDRLARLYALARNLERSGSPKGPAIPKKGPVASTTPSGSATHAVALSGKPSVGIGAASAPQAIGRRRIAKERRRASRYPSLKNQEANISRGARFDPSLPYPKFIQ